MREKKPRLIVTFHTTADAMAMEAACVRKSSGRLIPVPRELSAGCGIAFSAPVEEDELIRQILAEAGIEYEQLTECNV
ncbi:MAG: DUF3343 domain-containing protein [Lachnospiraceae bacterium]